jgi:trehalose utilization protein
MVCAYRRGESLTALARRYHHDLTRVRRALEAAGVTLRTRHQQLARNMAERQDTTRCRACGIILALAGCRSYEGACADCWREALKRARVWHCGIREAMERWIEEGRRIESGEAELGEWCGNIKRRAA